MNLLEIKDLSRSFVTGKNKLLVLQRMNMSVKKGELLSVLGPSGCGKSTLLRLIAGFLKPDSGSISLKGKPLSGPDADRIMVFQDFNQLFPWKTVLQNVVFPLKLKKVGSSRKEREEIARRYLARVQLDEFLHFYPHQLSGGMKQRAALARALATSPEIMLMDEPFASLDGQTRSTLQEMLLKIWQESESTIIFVTHDIREALLLSDRIVVMGSSPGRVKKVMENKLTRPRDQLSRDFTEMYKEIYGLL
ncbi:MAG: sulfonate transport system ATP-binding protein [Halanaerobiales bacterium]|nr:sulfonate transport system ATP-binding protein [Halanaerobiales bacterium]